MKKIIASLGGGFTSSAWMPRVLLNKYPTRNIEFINCVLPNEHPDMWRLFDALERELGIGITYIAYHPDYEWQYVDKADRGNKDLLFTPFDIFFEEGFLGNSRNDVCSRLLKRETIYNYVTDMHDPEQTEIAVGVHADEIDRAVVIRKNWKNNGWKVIFPISDMPTFSKDEEQQKMKEWYGMSLDLYDKGFEHNNCFGACIKAGQRQWARLWYYYPEIFSEWENLEREWNERFSNDYGRKYTTILRIVRNKKRRYRYITLGEFRKEILEPAASGEESGFIARMIEDLPGNPPCMWCSAI